MPAGAAFERRLEQRVEREFFAGGGFDHRTAEQRHAPIDHRLAAVAGDAAAWIEAEMVGSAEAQRPMWLHAQEDDVDAAGGMASDHPSNWLIGLRRPEGVGVHHQDRIAIEQRQRLLKRAAGTEQQRLERQPEAQRRAGGARLDVRLELFGLIVSVDDEVAAAFGGG